MQTGRFRKLKCRFFIFIILLNRLGLSRLRILFMLFEISGRINYPAPNLVINSKELKTFCGDKIILLITDYKISMNSPSFCICWKIIFKSYRSCFVIYQDNIGFNKVEINNKNILWKYLVVSKTEITFEK